MLSSPSTDLGAMVDENDLYLIPKTYFSNHTQTNRNKTETRETTESNFNFYILSYVDLECLNV